MGSQWVHRVEGSMQEDCPWAECIGFDPFDVFVSCKKLKSIILQTINLLNGYEDALGPCALPSNFLLCFHIRVTLPTFASGCYKPNSC